MMLSPAQQNGIAMAISNVVKNPILYGPNNRPLPPSSSYSYKRDAAKKTGSMRNWTPQKNYGRHSESTERSAIVARSVDLVNNDPHAAGIVENFATTEIGSGLVPNVNIDPELFGLDKKSARMIQSQQKSVYETWYPFADVGQRMNFGEIQFLARRSMLKFGEYVALLHMVKDPTRPYSLAIQLINPMRLKTPSDMNNNEKLYDGVELGSYGEPIAYWIKKSETISGRFTDDNSKNFIRIPAKRGHRINVIHKFHHDDPEQVRGMPFFAPAMKYFRDFNDLLNAELVSNVVTAALSYFIETSAGSDPLNLAESFASMTDESYNSDGESQDIRYQEVDPGMIMYGNEGEKPHLLSANRPGTTFEPFTKTIKKSMALSLNMPYAVLFKDVEGVNFAGFRAAMLDAWKVFSMHRAWHADGLCQPIFTMLQEEAFLMGQVEYSKFYENMHRITKAKWTGPPKGDIEPIKAINADILAIDNNLKTREDVMAERGEISTTVFEKLAEEKELLNNLKLTEEPEKKIEADNV